MLNNKQLSRKPFLSICITSYNRVNELYRCLKSVDTVNRDLIEIIVSEDCSPKKEKIAQIVNRFISETDYYALYNTNVYNLGYDRNLEKLIDLAMGEYILFISDDDVFCAKALDKIIDTLREIDCSVAFSPFISSSTGFFKRKFKKTMLISHGIKNVKKYLYCSILFSGLIFKKNQIIGYSADKFKNLIYFQVYLFASVLYRNSGCYIDVPLVQCINDGENAFGLSDSSEKNLLLVDRKSIYSNLEYHKGLIKVIEIFDNENGTDLINSFSTEYSLRAYAGMSKARKAGNLEFINYWDKMKSLNIKLSLIPKIYYWALKILGYKVSDFIFQIPRKILLGFRKRHITR